LVTSNISQPAMARNMKSARMVSIRTSFDYRREARWRTVKLLHELSHGRPGSDMDGFPEGSSQSMYADPMDTLRGT
jgi:hypothetical protein